ncbi:MAG: MFS transporter [Gammaproteobacteria bacterium]|nr:MFS transporter [Gammaproteobacteria bacterium]MCY4344210.1 MFS transporter [Gammaproteobacteria bacterium]
MRPLHYYLLGTGSWFLSVGIQGVMFAWLVTMVLRESPDRVGIAQMTLLLPGTLFILAGGSVADRYGGRRVAALAQAAGTLAPLWLLALVLADRLTFAGLLAYALVMGCAQAFVTPARDGLLNYVADGRIQRTVMLAGIAQFGTSILGFLLASTADAVGPALILGIQVLILAVGVVGFLNIAQPRRAHQPESRTTLMASVIEGATTVLRHRQLRMVALQNVAMALFFMGSYIVTLPLLVREAFNGSASDLGLMNACNSIGLVLAIFVLLRRGDVARQGRALIAAQFVGAIMLGAVALAPGFAAFLGLVFVWGACGGVAMTMSRTIMQEQAPDGQQGRVMGFHSFSFMGAGPLGALGSGYLVDEMGAQAALGISAAGMLAVVLMIGLRSSLWRMETAS